MACWYQKPRRLFSGSPVGIYSPTWRRPTHWVVLPCRSEDDDRAMDIRNITLHENGKWRLQKSFGIHGVALDWFRSYLVGRTQYVRRGSARSSIVYLTCCVPQGSVLGPILFIMYTTDLMSLVERYELSPHLYANDTQIYGSCSLCDADSFLTRVHEPVHLRCCGTDAVQSTPT